MRTWTYTTLSVVAAAVLLATPVTATPDACSRENTGQIGVFRPRDVPADVQMRLFLPDFVPGAGMPLETSAADLVEEFAGQNDPLALRERETLYPLVPLPPALQSMAALGSCVVVMRVYRRVRRHLRMG